MIKYLYKIFLSEKARNSIKELLNRLISPLYRGNKFYCNCCNKTFRKFLAKGNIKRLNARCPYCSSLERGRVLELYLNNELNIFESGNIKILHFAPERALSSKLKNIKNIEYIDADINKALARNVIDITNIPYPENYFEYIICSHVLGHVPNEQLAIEELHRVLKNDGKALILTLLGDNELTIEDENIKTPEARLNYYGEPDLCRLHGKDFANRLQMSGFNVEAIDYRLQFPEEIQKKQALGNGEREVIFRCTKS